MKPAEKIVFPARDSALAQPPAQPVWPAEEMLELLTRNMGATVALISPDLRFLYANASFANWFGLQPEQLVGLPIREIYGEHNHARYMPFVERAMAGETLHYQRQVRNPAGSEEWHTVCLSPCRNPQGEIIGVLTSALDVDELKTTAEALRTANQRLSSHMDNSPLAVIELDAELRLTRLSTRAMQLFGWGKGMHGQALLRLLSTDPSDHVPLHLALKRLQGAHETQNRLEVRHRCGDGSIVYCEWFNSALTDAQGKVDSIMALVEDVTSRVQVARQLEYLAQHDSLTGLLNRNAFQLRLDAALLRSRRTGEGVALLFIDLDGFKSVNDNFGHGAGDTVLREVAHRLSTAVRETDTVARLGGDEFVVLLDTDVQPATPEAVCARIFAALDAPFGIADRQACIGASIGVAAHPPLEGRAEWLINRADQAMYEAKRAGKGCVRHAPAD